MKVLVVANMAPFARSEIDGLAVQLERELVKAGHQSEIMRLPFRPQSAGIASQLLMVRGFELINVDRVIALQFPSCLIRHPNKTIWLLAPYLQHDESGEDEAAARGLRRLMRQAANESFAEARKLYSGSETVRQSLLRESRVGADILLPPLAEQELFCGGASEGYLYAGAAHADSVRLELLLQALALCPPEVRLVIGGAVGAPAERRLHEAAASLGVSDRVKLDLRALSREQHARYVNHAASIVCLSRDDASLGQPMMEAGAAGKPLIVAEDGVAVPQLCRDGETGWVVQPRAALLAAAMAQACANPGYALALGVTARQAWLQMDISWQKTVEGLLA
jgi:glycosyltransferase involved in cell wall biosynthesis